MPRRISSTAGTLLAVTLVACGGGTGPVTDRVSEANVRARVQGWVKAWNAHSAESLAPFYAQRDYLTVVWPTGDHTRGWTEESQLQRSFLPTVTMTNLAAQSPDVVLMRKDLALVTFPFTLDLSAGGAREIGPGEGTMLWQNEGGAWQIVAAHFSYTKAVVGQVNPQRR
ncbi:MAG TPA: nuclear transport factor 2 family protein [Gemmatimonadales bacterium]|jgi:ketosteroid isomerase-like protein|nr:nuclear transport factor 2 family protein [Gemmatimonadales bacterium]